MSKEKMVVLISAIGEQSFTESQAKKILAKPNGGGWQLKKENGSASKRHKKHITESDKQKDTQDSNNA